MGELVLDVVMQVLDGEGFPVERGYSQERVKNITEPVCAVNLESTNLDSMEVTVLVQVISPAELGAQACQQMAQEAGMALRDQGYGCTISACSFDGRTGTFVAKIHVTSKVREPHISVDGIFIPFACAFKCWRIIDENASSWTNARWYFRVEQLIPIDLKDTELNEGTFTLIHSSAGDIETFEGATWTSRTRTWEPTAIRQVRVGVAQTRTVS